MHDKLDFDQVIEDVGAEEEDEEIEVQSDDAEESAIENHSLVNFMKMFKKIKKIYI